MEIKRILWITALAAMAGCYLQAQPRVDGVEHISSSRADGNYVLMMDVNAATVKPGRNREITLTPVLRSTEGTDSLLLPTVMIAGRSRYFAHLRNGNIPAGEKMLRGGSQEVYKYAFSTPWQPWMEQSELTFITTSASCCDAPVVTATTPAVRHNYSEPQFAIAPLNVALTGDSAITVEAKGQAFIDFVVNRTELKPDYRGNRGELDKILRTIDGVATDRDVEITDITVKGYASPEGSYDNNVRLAMGRTQTLRDYVIRECNRRGYDFDTRVIRYDYEPEDWGGLIAWLESHDIRNRDEILAIARDSTIAPDPRNTKIQRQFPVQYRQLLEEVYPALRHSDYTIRYTYKTDVDVERLKERYKTDPSHLRPVDFYLIAKSYPAGSRDYEDVMLKAAEIYPTDEEALVNAANILMTRGEMDDALEYVNRLGSSPEGIYTKANYAARTGDLARAESLLRLAADRGYAPAAADLKEIQAILARPTVEYLIEND